MGDLEDTYKEAMQRMYKENVKMFGKKKAKQMLEEQKKHLEVIKAEDGAITGESMLKRGLTKYDINYDEIKSSYEKEIADLESVKDVEELVELIAYNLGKKDKVNDSDRYEEAEQLIDAANIYKLINVLEVLAPQGPLNSWSNDVEFDDLDHLEYFKDSLRSWMYEMEDVDSVINELQRQSNEKDYYPEDKAWED